MGYAGRLAESLEEQGFVIGARGLEKPAGAELNIQPNRVYWMGASSSPSMIFVTAVTDNSISYMKYPFEGSPKKMEKWIARDLIDKGTRTHLRVFAQHMDARLKKSLEDMLSGGKGKPEKLADYQYQYVLAKAAPGHEDEDLWREAERYGNVGGIEIKGVPHYEIHASGAALKELKGNKKLAIVKTSKKRAA